MASLENLVVKLHKEKQEAKKLKKKAETQMRKSLAVEKRSFSGLRSVEKKIQSEREESSGISEVLARKMSQLESVERLIAMAQEKLKREKEMVEETEQEIEFAESPVETESAEGKLRSLNDHIQELISEIKSRQKTAKKISDDVGFYSNIQSKLGLQIQKQIQSKASLRNAMITGRKSAKILSGEMEKQTKAEESAKKSLEGVFSRLEKNSKRKPAAKKTAAKRKPAAKKTAAKRKPAAKKTAAKRKI